MASPLSPGFNQQSTTALRNRQSLSILSLIGLGLALILFASLRSEKIILPDLAVQFSQTHALPGEKVEVLLSWKQGGSSSSVIDLAMDLPDSLGAVFVPGSLKVLNGSLKEALVLPYSGRQTLEMREVQLPDDSLLLLVSMIIPDRPKAQKGYPIDYRLIHPTGNFPLEAQGNGDSLYVVW